LIGSGSYHFAGVIPCLHDVGMGVCLLGLLFDPVGPAEGDVGVDLQVMPPWLDR
jgi:hypothetical protein